jgi:hypothetical protein
MPGFTAYGAIKVMPCYKNRSQVLLPMDWPKLRTADWCRGWFFRSLFQLVRGASGLFCVSVYHYEEAAELICKISDLFFGLGISGIAVVRTGSSHPRHSPPRPISVTVLEQISGHT